MDDITDEVSGGNPGQGEVQHLVPYSSIGDTLAHGRRVGVLLAEAVVDLTRRSVRHDLSKTLPPEVEVFDRYTPELEKIEYGSERYMANLEAMGPGLQHHFAHNRHHPEWHDQGVNGMTLMDVLEMTVDWLDHIEQKGGDVEAGMRGPQERFGISDQLMQIMINTAHELRWNRTP